MYYFYIDSIKIDAWSTMKIVLFFLSVVRLSLTETANDNSSGKEEPRINI